MCISRATYRQAVLITLCVLWLCFSFSLKDVWGKTLYKEGVRLQDPKPALLSGFGLAVAIESDSIVVGAPHAAGPRGQVGKAFLFDRETGGVKYTFQPSSPIGNDLFGLSVGLTDQFVIVGAPRAMGKTQRAAGKVSVFDRKNGRHVRDFVSPNPNASVFGHAFATHGPWLAVGDPGAGSSTQFEVGEVYVFELGTGRLVRTIVAPEAPRGKANGFGHALAFLGSSLAVGAPLGGGSPLDQGLVYLFSIQNGTLLKSIQSTKPHTNEYFGWSLASDEGALLIGALGRGLNAQTQAGAAYVFSNQGEFQMTLELSNPQKDDHFGETVALMNDYLVVAAPGHDAAGTDAGTVFFFNRQTGLLRRIMSNPSENTGVADLFGLSLGAIGEHLVVGAPYGDLPEMPDSGEVHQFSFQFKDNLN